MTTVAEADIRIGLNDAEAIAGLREVDAQFDRTMRDIDRKKATVKIEGDLKPLEKDLAQAKKMADAYEKKVSAQQNKGAQTQMRKKLEKMRLDETAHRKTLDHARAELAALKAQHKQEAMGDRARAAASAAAARQHREALKRANDLQRERNKAEADERRMMRMHADAANMDRRLTRERIVGASREEAQIARLQERYRKLAIERQKLDRRATRLHTLASPSAKQKVEIDRHSAVVEMEALRAELEARGHQPIHQEIDLDVDRANSALSRWLKGLNETAIRIGPITTSIAGLGRGLLLLGPIISGVVGQLGALVAVLSSGILGGVGIAGGAVAAFAVSLGGVGLLMPSLLRDFKNLSTLQKAYNTQVLKTGADSPKAKTKLEEFQHAMGAVEEPTRRAFNALDQLRNRWHKLTRDTAIRTDFFEGLTSGLDTINHHFDWFRKNTIAAFHAVAAGWEDWNKRLQSGDADRVLATLGKNANKSIGPLMHGLGNLGAAFGKIAASFSRWLPELLRGFDAWSGRINDSASDTETLNTRVDDMVGSFRSLGHFIQAAGNFLVALFAPGVDPGRKMLDSWTVGLNNAAEAMRGVKRTEIRDFFERSIDTANRFWSALKPLVQLFFEWSTIMQPFTNVALDFFGALGRVLQVVLDFGPTKGIMQAAFGVFLVSTVLQRARGIATAIWSIAKGIGAIKAAGGLGSALKGGLSRMFNPLHGVRGATPATPMFVKDVGLPGKLPGGGAPIPGRAPGGGGIGTLLSQLPRLVKIGGGVAALAGAFYELHKNVLKIEQSHATKKVGNELSQMIASRNIEGIRALVREMDQYGGGLDKLRKPAHDALKAVQQLENGIATSSINRNFENIQRNGAASMSAIKNTVRTNMGIIRSRMDTNSDEGRAAIAHNFKLAEQAIRNRMRESGKHTKEGMALVKQYAVAGMKAMGLTDAQANAKFKTGTLKNSEDRPGAATIPGKKNARGGVIQIGRKGQKGADSVPMNLGGVPSVVAPGEQIAVFNDHQQRRLAQHVPGGLEGFFNGPQPRHGFAGGGIVALGKELQAEGYTVSENPAFGGVSPVHAPNSYHYRGMAIDVNADTFPGGEGPALDKLYARLKGMAGVVELLWRVAGHFDHLHVAMAGNGVLGGIKAPKIDGAFTDLPGIPGVAANRAMAVGRSAGQGIVDAVASTLAVEGGEGGVGNPGKGSATRAQMEAWAKQALAITQPSTGWGPSAANVASILTLAMKESSWIVDSINNWDSNAKAGNPSGGLMHVTLDKVGGSMAALFNPIQNMVASIMYQFKQYHRLVTFSPYEKGGIVDTMGAEKWSRGGKIDKPTLLTGEDGRAHPEFVVGTNPQFKKSNVAALQSAASALGISTARGSTKHKKPLKARNTGRDVDNLPYVKEYAKWQTREEDKQREISIAQSRIHEPESFIKQTGTDANGEPTYVVDEKVVNDYKAQMKAVTKLYGDLVGGKGGPGHYGGIMGALLAAGRSAMNKLARYRDDRDGNIGRIQEAIARDEALLGSKDKDVRKAAQKRLVNNRAVLQEQRQKKQDAGQKRGDIGDDVHDANFRAQEYQVDRDDIKRDIAAIGGRAADEATSANPTPEEGGPGVEPTDANELRLAGLEAELALAQIGQGINGQPPRAIQDILADQAKAYQAQIEQARAMLVDTDPTNDLDAYNLISSAASALQQIQGELAKYDPATNAKLLGDMTRSAINEFGSNFVGVSGMAGMVTLGGSRAGSLATGAVTDQYKTPPFWGGGNWSKMTPAERSWALAHGGAAMPTAGKSVTINNTFANVPPDPHTWSKGIQFELGGAI